MMFIEACDEEKYVAKAIADSRKYADAILVVDGGSKDDNRGGRPGAWDNRRAT